MKLIYSKPHGSTEMIATTKLFPEYFGIDTTKPKNQRFPSKKVIGNIEEKETKDILRNKIAYRI